MLWTIAETAKQLSVSVRTVQRLLDDGRFGSISEMAAAEGIERGYLGSVLRLTLLAPEVVQVLLDGRAPADLTLRRLLEPFPTCWAEQGALFGCRTSTHTGARS